MQAFVEQDVGATRDIFPGSELTWIQVHAEASVVLRSLFGAVEVITLLTSTRFAVDAEQLFELVEEVGFRTEVEKFSPFASDSDMAVFIAIRSKRW